MLIKIRQMSCKDKPALLKILYNTPEFNSSEVTVAEEVIDSYLTDMQASGYHICVAEADLKIAGYICYGPTPQKKSTWDIYWIVVLAEKQGRGIGGLLIAHAEDKIREAQGKIIIIETSSTLEYKKTRQFYLNRGYQLIDRTNNFYSHGDDRLILQKQFN